MRALVLRGASHLLVRDAPDPRPGFGQVLAEVKACGICGSDLHFVQHAATMLGLLADMQGLARLRGATARSRP
jgi:threonine dehydrogenase-like Zn-dependent dehydrogenase